MNLSRMVRRGVPALAVAALLAPTALVGLPAGAKSQDERSGNGVRAIRHWANRTKIEVRDGSPARDPNYPSTIFVENVPGTIEDLNVRIRGLDYFVPDDLDILLQGPTGETFIIMSDVGGNHAVRDLDIWIDDEAERNPLPDDTPLSSGTYSPKNYNTTTGDNDKFPSVAAAENKTSLAGFRGISPNGTWKLFVRDDDTNNQAGEIKLGWELRFQTTNSGPVARTDHYKVKENTRLVVGAATGVLKNDYDVDGPPDSFWLTHALTRPKHGNLTIRRDGSFTYTPRKNFDGKDGFSYQIQDSQGEISNGYVAIKVQNDKSLDKKADKGKKKNNKGNKGTNRR